MSLNVAVLMGGNSAEAEVSRNSAREVAEALTPRHRATLIEVDAECTAQLSELAPDVVFPALHGPPGEDGTIQGYLEMLGLPYVGSDVRGCALAMDKAVAKLIFAQYELPILSQVLVKDESELIDKIEEIKIQIGPAVVIKPLNQGSAIGVTPLPNGGDIQAAVQAGLAYGPCMVEPYLVGKEITVGVLEHAHPDRLEVHPVIEIRTQASEWYDYHNRYAVGQSEHVVPADLSASCQATLQDIALKAHEVLGLRDLSRADFIVTDTEEIALLEVNALPGMTPTSLYPDGARHLGYSFADLVDLLVRQAKARGPR